MGKVTYIEFSGRSHEVEANDGQSLMEAAVGNLVPGIVADCGGACACATCHVYLDEGWMQRAAPASEMETEMLEMVMHRQSGSRLSCQLKMTASLDGVVLRLPVSQT